MFNKSLIPTLTSKTRERAFQVLNRTIWTNNKAFKPKMRPGPNCDKCGEVETMEHLLCECMHYSQLLWDHLGEVITRYLNADSTTYVPKVDITQLNIIYNAPHPSLLMYIPDKLTRNSLLILMQELKRYIIYRVQKSGDHWQPLGFFSRKLTDTEYHYFTFDCELLAAHAAIKHFCHF